MYVQRAHQSVLIHASAPLESADMCCLVLLSVRQRVRVASTMFNTKVESFDASASLKPASGDASWTNYVLGVFAEYAKDFKEYVVVPCPAGFKEYSEAAVTAEAFPHRPRDTPG